MICKQQKCETGPFPVGSDNLVFGQQCEEMTNELEKFNSIEGKLQLQVSH